MIQMDTELRSIQQQVANPLFCELVVQEFEQQVHLGCLASERVNPQPVRFTVRLRLESLPEGCFSDHLADTVCYARITDLIRQVSQQQEFSLVESLAHQSLSAIRNILPAGTRVQLQVHKLNPPIKDLMGGVVFTCGDSLS